MGAGAGVGVGAADSAAGKREESTQTRRNGDAPSAARIAVLLAGLGMTTVAAAAVVLVPALLGKGSGAEGAAGVTAGFMNFIGDGDCTDDPATVVIFTAGAGAGAGAGATLPVGTIMNPSPSLSAALWCTLPLAVGISTGLCGAAALGARVFGDQYLGTTGAGHFAGDGVVFRLIDASGE